MLFFLSLLLCADFVGANGSFFVLIRTLISVTDLYFVLSFFPFAGMSVQAAEKP